MHENNWNVLPVSLLYRVMRREHRRSEHDPGTEVRVLLEEETCAKHRRPHHDGPY